MRRYAAIIVALTSLHAACGGTPPTATVDPRPTQTRAAELAQIATLSAPTATPTATATPVPQPTPTVAPTATIAPSPTAAATATPRPPAPTATPRPSPTAVPSISVAAENVSNYRDSAGGLWFIGELVNQGQTEAGGMEVAISLLDPGGQTIGTGKATTFGVPILKGGERTVWRALISNAPQAWATERVQAQAKPVAGFERELYHPDLKVEGVTLAPPENQYGWVKASGQIVNGGTRAAQFAQATVGLYDAEGKLTAVGFAFSRLEQVPPGGSAPFSVDFIGTKDLPAKFEVYVSGHFAR